MAIENPYFEIEDSKEIEVLRHDLFNKFKGKSSYGCVGHTANYWYLCYYFGDSSFKIRAQVQIDGNEDLLNAIENNLGHGTFRNAEDFVRRVRALAASSGQHQDGDVIITILRPAIKDANLDGKQYSQWNNQRANYEQSSGNIYDVEDNVSSGRTSSLISDWNNDFAKFMTHAGEIYGFIDSEGNVYLDETKISPEHSIHEYTHLWDRVITEKNPKLWERGIQLMKILPTLQF